ncbi:iron-containing alcohol dehydrogenase [Anaerocolumna sp. AGMB13025]|uniref:iron-containing alcohol dehydrogenase n=1 Tax=Anaerocolumna sp. AGMB13025 TaxID=3039116 RepID=UPI00241CC655|nr:iron-containing alcohol dehydrogenase [Anaerocolumna sp. AGMB13025]WFR59780.1 iron-containing alcohol dehydrogenase [Anaerocolumna sp. AGMB13025]
MKEFSFSVPQDIIFGEGSIKKVEEILKKNNWCKPLIISGKNLTRLGVADKIIKLVEKAGCKAELFNEVEANPSVETVEKAALAFKESGADSIIALGGGSPMDVAKAVGIVAVYGGNIKDYEGGSKVPGKITPIIAIPTTAGTGSEVTAFTVITDHARNYKLTVFSYELIPQYAILDPELILSLSGPIAAATGIDALVHAIEAYLSKAASPFTDAFAEKAMELIGENLRSFTADRTNLLAASAMLTGSMFAGLAFAYARLGNVHAMAHPLGGFFNVSHGVANAILLPVVMEYNALSDKGRYKKIYGYLVPDRKVPEDFTPDLLIKVLKEMTVNLGIPKNLQEVGVTEDMIPAMAEDAMKSGNILVNPRQSTLEDIILLYKKAMG